MDKRAPRRWRACDGGNGFLNGHDSPDYGPVIKKRTQIKRPNRTFVFIDHVHEGSIDAANCGWFAILKGDTFTDNPATWHAGGCVLSFVDGHSEYHKWTDARTLQVPILDAKSPGNRDLEYLQSVMGY